MQNMISSAAKGGNILLKIFKPSCMASLKYTIIRSKAQYTRYCKKLEDLLDSGLKTRAATDEIDLLTLLIEKWDAEHNTFDDADPVELLHFFMKDHNMKAKDLVDLLKLSKGYVSDILHYKKGLSKDVIRKLANHFKVSQEAFNRPYSLKTAGNSLSRSARSLNSRKKLAAA